MRKFLVLLVLTALILSSVHEVNSPSSNAPQLVEDPILQNGRYNTASASGDGSSQTATMFFKRIITGQRLEIFNSYGDTATHNTELDLSNYQVPGWRLFSIEIDSASINAAVEREVVGNTPQSYDFKIFEEGVIFYSQLAQGFYNQPHDGALVNFSIYYLTNDYSPLIRGNASIAVRTGSSSDLDSATDITTPVNMTASDSMLSWTTVQGGNASMSADTVYWAIIDGSNLLKAGDPFPSYPTISWSAESGAGTFGSYQRGPGGWGSLPLEALLNYSYIPWNQTSDAPLVFSSPQQVDLKGNSSTITSSSFTFSSATKNITSISFDTNQSIYFDYNMTLAYEKQSSTTTSWEITASSGLVDWSVGTSVSYPSVSGQISRYLNMSKASSWTITGLYESSAPTTNHTSYTVDGTTMVCASMTDGSWRMAASSYNLLAAVHTYDSSNDDELFSISSILVDVDVNISILEQDSDPVNTGLANLTIIKSGSVVWSPSNKSVSGGIVNYLWNIDQTTSDNGVFTIEVSWANGTDAGYLVKELTVFYPTSLTASVTSIDAYTESSFEVRVYFEDTFTPQGLFGAVTDVVYSFDGGLNVSMTDHNNGTWSATISTSGKNPGTYIVDIYAESYAVQNRSIQISTTLIHDTEILSVAWSNTNDITYIEATELTVYYNRVTGSTPISGANVNVTIGSDTWPLVWDGSSAYRITFNGTDVPPGFGTHDLTIEAWKGGHKAQSDSSQTLTIQEEPTNLTYAWSNTNSITYVESTKLSVNYTKSDGSAVTGATVNVTTGSDTFILVWNGGTETYDYVFNGDASPGIGVHSLTIEAGKLGHEYKSALSVPFTISEEPTTLTLTWSNGFDISYIEETYLIAFYNMSDGSPVLGAVVNVTIGTDVFILNYYAPIQGYRVLFNGSDSPPGFGTHPITVQANLFGYVSKSDSSETLTLQEDSTTLLLSWSDGDIITYIQQTTLSASYTMSNSSAIRNALVNVTIGSNNWILAWHEASETYRKIFYGTDVPPGFGVHNLTVEADRFGFAARSNPNETLTITEVPTNYTLTWSNGFDITYIQETYLIVNYTMTDGSPVLSATVNVTINGQVFDLAWYEPTQTYHLLIRGSDNPPGFGDFPITVRADRHGYTSYTDSTETLTLQEDPTTLLLSWSDSDNITYVGQTILSASYTMSNGSAIRGALLNVTIDGNTWLLVWHEATETYRKTFFGSDDPPGFGTYSVNVEADLFGFVSRTDSTKQLTITEEPTTLTVSWSNGSSITYVEQTTISVSYRMNNTTPISGAIVTVTIGLDVWPLTWNPGSEVYETTFNGTDDPPGIEVHSLSIDASRYGFESQSDNTESLTIVVESTSLQLSWWVSNIISYVEQTVLYANYTMSNGTAVLGAYVTVAIGSANKTLEWNSISKVYFVILEGDDPAFNLGVHTVTVEGTKFGYQKQTDNTQSLTVLKASTSLTPSWDPADNITYFESTTLSVRYELSSGSAIPGATVNITIGVDVWILTWNPVSEAYETTISGSDIPPGYGTHALDIRASKYGYSPILDSTQQLTIRLEDTNISFEWQPSSTITYVGATKIRIFYFLRNGTPVQGATVNITRGPTRWDAVWNMTSQAYEYAWLGTDDPPGIGSHMLVIRAWKINYVGITDLTQTLTINEEPTLIQASWSNGHNITYVQSTKLLVNFTDSNGVVIPEALVDVTIDSDNWILSWNATSQLYEITFAGSDSPPGLGNHSLSIRGWQFGYETTIDSSQTLILRIEPTTLTPSWLPTDSITYVESTILSVRYEMSNGDPVSGAILNVTIGVDVWPLTWNEVSEAYEVTFRGNDNPPGIGAHSMLIQASRFGFQSNSDSSEVLTIVEEPTSFVISWSDGNNITYVFGTVLTVRYQMSNTSSIPGALVNATIDGTTWALTWNPVSESYERYFAGSDDPPGYGTHTVEIRVSKSGYESLIDSTQQITIRPEDTSMSFEWIPSATITYVESNKIRIFYVMSNGTPIIGATVNLTIDTDLWVASWNSTSEAYEVSFLGSDSPPGLGTHILIVKTWKMNYIGLIDSSQTLTINEKPTQVQVSWTNGNSITYVETTTLRVNYTTSNGTIIPSATVNVTIGVHTWNLVWNGTSQLYELTFSNGSAWWPGLGTHGLTIRAWKFGYKMTVNIAQTLIINSEQVDISSTLLNGGTITYVESTILQVNYTTSDGNPIAGATVNVTVDGTLWDLVWHAASETYRIQFNGSDADPGFGTHNLIVNASAYGFDALTDSSLFLIIQEEPTTLTAYWGAPNFNDVTYFEYTILYVEYRMSNSSDILGASVNVTIGTMTWVLGWNSTAGAYSLQFNGSDNPPGFGTHGLLIEAALYGYQDGTNTAHTLTLAKDPTSIEVSWTNGNNITYIGYTVLSVVYRMSNGTIIQGAAINATIGVDLWVLSWNETAGAYQVQFDGNQSPPDLGTFIVNIQASATNFEPQSPSTSLTLRTESTTAAAAWSSTTIDWTESVVLSIDYKDSFGSLVSDATTKLVYIDGVEYTLQGTNGTYWIEFSNAFDLGLHPVWANFSKYGYDPALALSISFNITNAQTDLAIVWSSTVIDFLGQIDLTADYYYTGDGTSVPPAGVIANITIDGEPYDLNLQGGFWTANLTGSVLGLGNHIIDIRAQAYGYEYREALGIVLTVNEVSTDALTVDWTPSNVTIEYTDTLGLTVDYTFYGVDVPTSATVNVSIEGLLYNLTYSSGDWSVSIPGSELGIGVRTATISAWLYGYQGQVNVTLGINVTVAANSFLATWEPLDLQATYIDTVNLSVVYTEDFVPIVGSNVRLSINGTIYTLTFSPADEMWHFSMEASDIGLGVWNVTVTANKTGYADGRDSRLLTISLTPTNLTVSSSAIAIYYDENITLNIYYQLLNTSVVPGATCVVTVDSVVQSVTWITDHWTVTMDGSVIDLGVHSVAVNVEAFGYDANTKLLDVTVNAIPTSVTVDSTTYQVYPFDSVTVSFTWWDDKNSAGITGSTPGVIWPDFFSLVDHGNGTYSVTAENDALHIGFYQLNVTFSRRGYTLSESTIIIEIVKLPIVLIFSDEIEQYENETVTVSIQIYDGPHATIVDWGEIMIELEGQEYQLLYSSDTHRYSVEIWLAALSPGMYTLNFTASATDCETEIGEFHLQILPKILYTIVIEIDEQITAGQPIQISIQVTNESEFLEGFEVVLHIIVEKSQGAPQIFLETASDSYEFSVPIDATELAVWAEFEGTIREWPAVSNTINREVTPGGMDILSFIISLFEDPITLTIIFGGGGGSIGGLILLRRRRRSFSSTSVAEPVIAPTSIPIAPRGEMDVLQDKIKGSIDGLTRAEIAQFLEISTSKAGELVKNLLNSNPAFEEVREGRLRKIRFRGGE